MVLWSFSVRVNIFGSDLYGVASEETTGFAVSVYLPGAMFGIEKWPIDL